MSNRGGTKGRVPQPQHYMENRDKYMLLWAQLLDMGVISALEMIRVSQPSENPMMILKKALQEQSQTHYQANIEILSKLSKC